MSFHKVALFGANGQIGVSMLTALVTTKKQKFDVIAIVPPETGVPDELKKDNLTVKELDVMNASKDDLAELLRGVDVVVSALNGKPLEAQSTIQDAAADAGVKRFYPSEYGYHHIYRKPGDPQGYLHPLWDMKEVQNERAVRHPAIESGKMSYTMIGCGDFYNQDREKTWCPWTQTDVDSFTFHIIGNPDAKADYTHIDDLAQYLVATLCEPEKSHNAHLNFPSDTISHNEIASLLEKYSGKKVNKELLSLDEMHKIVNDPSKAPKELSEGSAFPVDFWFLVKGIQGEGRFFRPKGERHNHVFPEVQVTTFDKYLKEKHGK